MKTKIGVLVSGGGTNLQALIDAQKSGILHSGEIAVVVSNVKGAYALTRAENASVRHETVLRRECSCAKEFEQKIDDIMRSCGVELIILAGFLYVLSKDFVQKWPDRIINIHPSLIPSFCGDGFYGLKVHEEALKYGVKVSGATVHFVNEVTDGGRIIAQKAVYIQDGDTPEILQKRIMEQAEWVLLPQAAEEVSKMIMEGKN